MRRLALLFFVVVLMLLLHFFEVRAGVYIQIPDSTEADSIMQAAKDSLEAFMFEDTVSSLSKVENVRSQKADNSLAPPPLSEIISTRKILWSLVFISFLDTLPLGFL